MYSCNKPAKSSGQYGGGGFSLFDFDNMPDFEPLQAALALLQAKVFSAPHEQHGGYGGYDEVPHEQVSEQPEQEVTPQLRAERMVMGLTKLLSVSDYCLYSPLTITST